MRRLEMSYRVVILKSFAKFIRNLKSFLKSGSITTVYVIFLK